MKGPGMGFHFSKFGDYEMQIVDNPSQTLPQSSQDQFIRQCTELSRESFQNPNLNYDGLKSCIIDSSTSFFITNQQDDLIGFASYSLFKIESFDLIYLQSSAVSNSYQNQGIWQHLLLSRISHAIQKLNSQSKNLDLDCLLIGCRTQNPVLYRFLNRKLGCFPNPDGTSDPTIKDIAKKFARTLYDHQHNPETAYQFQFDDDAFVTKHAYKKAYSFASNSDHKDTGANIYNRRIPFCNNDDEINNFMKAHMDWEKGDVITTIGYYCKDKIDLILNKTR